MNSDSPYYKYYINLGELERLEIKKINVAMGNRWIGKNEHQLADTISSLIKRDNLTEITPEDIDIPNLQNPQSGRLFLKWIELWKQNHEAKRSSRKKDHLSKAAQKPMEKDLMDLEKLAVDYISNKFGNLFKTQTAEMILYKGTAEIFEALSSADAIKIAQGAIKAHRQYGPYDGFSGRVPEERYSEKELHTRFEKVRVLWNHDDLTFWTRIKALNTHIDEGEEYAHTSSDIEKICELLRELDVRHDPLEEFSVVCFPASLQEERSALFVEHDFFEKRTKYMDKKSSEYLRLKCTPKEKLVFEQICPKKSKEGLTPSQQQKLLHKARAQFLFSRVSAYQGLLEHGLPLSPAGLYLLGNTLYQAYGDTSLINPDEVFEHEDYGKKVLLYEDEPRLPGEPWWSLDVQSDRLGVRLQPFNNFKQRMKDPKDISPALEKISNILMQKIESYGAIIPNRTPSKGYGPLPPQTKLR